jgi:hypothetical protein
MDDASTDADWACAGIGARWTAVMAVVVSRRIGMVFMESRG